MAPQIEAAELFQRMQAGENVNLLDVREPIEFHTFNIGGINIPMMVLTEKLVSATYNKSIEIVVVCKIGKRSEAAAKLLNKWGFTQVRNLKGGLTALRKIEYQHN